MTVAAALDPLALAVSLMEIDSTSGREGAVIDWTDRFLSARGWRTARIPVTAGRDDLVATVTDRPSDAPRITFSTHLDTVPPFIPPRVDGDRLLGRGACDAKGIAAAMICAAERLRSRGVSVSLLFVVGEEVSHDGADAANRFAAGRARATGVLVNGEPTGSTLAVGTKGAVRVIVRTRGQAAHSAYPERGRSATRDLVRLLSALDDVDWPEDPVLGRTTVNIGHLAGGVADNVLAPAAEARLMFRLVTPLADTRPIIQGWAAERAELEWGVSVDPVRLTVLPGFRTSVAAFATDIPVLTNWGRPLLFGPGSIHVAHSDGEFVDVAELRSAVDAYERVGDMVVNGGMDAAPDHEPERHQQPF